MKSMTKKTWRLVNDNYTSRRPVMLYLVTLNLMLAAPAALAQTFTPIVCRDAVLTQAFGINPDGDIVGGYTDTQGVTHGFLLRGDNSQCSTIDFPGAIFTQAVGINRRSVGADIVGAYTDTENVGHGFLLREGKFTRIDCRGATFTTALGNNDTGDIVGRYVSADGVNHGFLLRGFSPPEPGECHTIDGPDSLWTNVQQINSAGEMVGRYDTASGVVHVVHGYRLTGEKFIPIDAGDFVSAAQIVILTHANGINPDGDDIVGRYITANGMTHGFLLSGDRFSAIDFPNAIETQARGITPTGDIVGFYIGSDGVTRGFLRLHAAASPSLQK